MLELDLKAPGPGRALTVLAVGAHSDDLEIGCGATIIRLVKSGLALRVVWVVLSAPGARAEEATRSAEAFLAGAPLEIRIGRFRDAFFPHDEGVKEFFEGLKRDVVPDVLFTHARHDLHQDHRVVCELTWNTFRDQLILEYEIPKFDGDLRSPNVFVPVDEETAARKCRLLMEHFATQRDKDWFTEDVFLGLMRLRGVESRSPTGYAEGFYGRKLRIGMPP